LYFANSVTNLTTSSRLSSDPLYLSPIPPSPWNQHILHFKLHWLVNSMSMTFGLGDQKYDRRKEENFAELGKNINLMETSKTRVSLYIRSRSQGMLSFAYCSLFSVK